MIYSHNPHSHLCSFYIKSQELLQDAEEEEIAQLREEKIVTKLFFKYGKVIIQRKGPCTKLCHYYFFNKEKKEW